MNLFVDTAFSHYSADARKGTANDLGAFTAALLVAIDEWIKAGEGPFWGPDAQHFINRSYRHFQNEQNYNHKEVEQAMIDGIGIATAEIATENRTVHVGL